MTTQTRKTKRQNGITKRDDLNMKCEYEKRSCKNMKLEPNKLAMEKYNKRKNNEMNKDQ